MREPEMANATDRQLDFILKLANQLTGERARYLSQSSAVSAPKTSAEASALIDELQEAIKAEEKRAESGVVVDADVAFTYTWKDGSVTEVRGTVDGYRWSGLRVVSIWLRDMDEATRGRGKDRVLFALDRTANLTVVTEDPEILRNERARLLARVVEIDAILAGSTSA
jgi:hypothetical protein